MHFRTFQINEYEYLVAERGAGVLRGGVARGAVLAAAAPRHQRRLRAVPPHYYLFNTTPYLQSYCQLNTYIKWTESACKHPTAVQSSSTYLRSDGV